MYEPSKHRELDIKKTDVVFSNKREEGVESRTEFRAQSSGEGSNEIASGRDQNGIIFSLILRSIIFLVLIGILLTEGLLF